MNSTSRSKILRIILFILLASTAIATVWFLYDRNPNTIFKRLERDFRQENPLLSDTTSITDYVFSISSRNQLNQEKAFFQQYGVRLKKIAPEQLSARNKATYLQLEQRISEHLKELHALQTDPSLYNLGGELKVILSNDSIPLDGRLLHIGQSLKEADIYYLNAKANLIKPHPDKTSLAIQKQLRTLNFLNGELLDPLMHSNLSTPEREEITQKTAQAKIAVKDYLAFCRSLLFEQRDSTFSK